MNEPDTLTFGIVGLGNIAATHAAAINGLNHAEVAAACSRNEKNREAFSQEFDVPVFADYSEFLNQDINAVSICTPSGTHLEYGRLAAEAGKHVIVEKPIDVTVKRGLELIECCKQNGVKLAVIYQNRFNDGLISLKKALYSGQLGKPIMVRASVKWFRDQHYYEKSGWRGTLKLDGGGAVINQAIHTIDLLCWLFGEVSSVSAYKGTFTHPGIEAEDNAVAVMKFKSDLLGVFEASTSIVPAQPRTIEINGTKGTAILKGDRFRIAGSEPSGSTENKQPAGAASPLSGLTSGPHQNQYKQIVDAIIQDLEPVVSGEESLYSLAIAEAIYKSADNETFVNPSDILGGK